MLCVAIHDVAPATWPECQQLVKAVRAVADIPLTLLVVPHFHGSAVRAPAFELALDGLLEKDHELALHGYTHVDTGAPPASLRARLQRRLFTQAEGEFAAIGSAEARKRIELGLAWFAVRGWPVAGFVAPAWLLGRDAWPALRSYAFTYTTTLAHMHLLQAGRKVWAPALVYAARNKTGRLLSPVVASAATRAMVHAPLLRLALHPRDARYPRLLRHMQGMLESLLAQRTALTKLAAAHTLQAA
jgi:uncharacterized protein